MDYILYRVKYYTRNVFMRVQSLFLLFFLLSALSVYAQDAEESKILYELINMERQKAGLYEYKTDENIEKAAATRAEEISKVFDSVRPDGSEIYTVYAENGIKVAYYGESIRTGYETASAMLNAMLKDPDDSSSILDIDYTHIGVGIYKNAKNTSWAIIYCSLAE